MQKRKKSNDSLSDIFKDAGCDEALEKQLIVLKQTGQTSSCDYLQNTKQACSQICTQAKSASTALTFWFTKRKKN